MTRDELLHNFPTETNSRSVNILDSCAGANTTFVSYNCHSTLIELTFLIRRCKVVDDNLISEWSIGTIEVSYVTSSCLAVNCANCGNYTFLSICNSGLHPGNLNFMAYMTNYESVVILKALYACKLWNTYSTVDLLNFEIYVESLFKTIQRVLTFPYLVRILTLFIQVLI